MWQRLSAVSLYSNPLWSYLSTVSCSCAGFHVSAVSSLKSVCFFFRSSFLICPLYCPFGDFHHLRATSWTEDPRSPFPHPWFIFSTSATPWTLNRCSAPLPNQNDSNDTQKRRLSSFGISAVLHVSHPLAITSANKLIQCGIGKRVGTVGAEEVRRGLGVWKEGLEDSFCSVLSLQISKSIDSLSRVESVSFKQADLFSRLSLWWSLLSSGLRCFMFPFFVSELITS